MIFLVLCQSSCDGLTAKRISRLVEELEESEQTMHKLKKRYNRNEKSQYQAFPNIGQEKDVKQLMNCL